MAYNIITHSGKAHMDELIGITLIAIHRDEMPTEIIRVETDKAIECYDSRDNSIDHYLVDCGLLLEPENFKFDHHQSKDLGCAAILIFDHYFPHLENSSLHEYIKLVSAVDTRGPNSLDDFKFNSESINYFSFPQKLLLREFEQQPILITSIFLNGIKSIIEFEKEKIKAESWLKTEEHSTIFEIDGVNILVYNNPPPVELSNAIKSVDAETVELHNIHVIYGFDKDDNNIRTLYRTFKGDDEVDFTKAEVNNTLFSHKGGFLLKFIPESNKEWIKIIKESKK
ncbi:MAG: MYG1 family protein [Spirochaetaceae bacterium]